VPLSVAGRRYISDAAWREGVFLEAELPLQAFATLTMPHNASQMMLDDVFPRWANSVQTHNRLTIGWIRAYEHDPQRHIHAVLLAGNTLDCFHAEMLWRELVARGYSLAAKVEPYRYGVGGLSYVLKSLGSPTEDVHFSHNLSAFSPHRAFRFFGRTRTERRQIRRIQAQRGT
jgi:hypothetical protein